MKAQTHDYFNELADAARRFLVGAVLFIASFAALLWLIRDVFAWALAVLKAAR
jgi:hypothetical protein